MRSAFRITLSPSASNKSDRSTLPGRVDLPHHPIAASALQDREQKTGWKATHIATVVVTEAAWPEGVTVSSADMLSIQFRTQDLLGRRSPGHPDLLLAVMRRSGCPLDRLPLVEITRQIAAYVKQCREQIEEAGLEQPCLEPREVE